MRLIKIDELEPWYCRNPFIIGGYRNPKSPVKAFLSVFEWHNETLNIYSHFLPGLIWLYMSFSYANEEYYLPTEPFLRYLIHFSYAAAAFMGFSSAFAHTFYIVNQKWHDMCWKLDFVGIIVINITHQILDTYILLYMYPTLFHVALSMQGIFSTLCIYDVITEKTKINWGIVYPIMASTVLTIPAAISAYSQSSVILHFISNCSIGCSILVCIAGGVFYIGKIPERIWNPRGILDNFNSHVWFHLTIVASLICAFRSVPYLHMVMS
jgi:adiponectin receptor